MFHFLRIPCSTSSGIPRKLARGTSPAALRTRSRGIPFAGGTIEEVQRRIRRQRLAAGGPDASAAPTAATAVAVFAASILTAPRAGRPDIAPAFAAALAEVPRTA